MSNSLAISSLSKRLGSKFLASASDCDCFPTLTAALLEELERDLALVSSLFLSIYLPLKELDFEVGLSEFDFCLVDKEPLKVSNPLEPRVTSVVSS